MSESTEPQEPNIGWQEALGAEAVNPPEVRTVGGYIRALDKDWTVSAVENGIKAQFEQFVRRKAQQLVSFVSSEQGDMEAESYRSRLLADWGAGHYNWDGKHCVSARQDAPGVCYLLYLLLRRCHPEITLETATEIFKAEPKQCAIAYGWALGNFLAPKTAGQAQVPDEELKNRLKVMVKEKMAEISKRNRQPQEPVTMNSP